jgi:membrane-associated protease RseP (regulator of RpoE activity)
MDFSWSGPTRPLPMESREDFFLPPARPVQRRGQLAIHIALFLITFGTVTLNGVFLEGHNPFTEPKTWVTGLPFAVALMSILLLHELGHYLTARYHKVQATLPYFLPAPPFFIGTFGAFIRLSSLPPSRSALFDVGASGPWAGFVVSLVALILGLHWSELRPVSPDQAGLLLGDSLLTKALTALVVGPIPEGFDLYFHPVAFAGWVGLLVTFFNLMPVGQLDGGHVVYALFPTAHPYIARFFWFTIAWMGLPYWPGWFVWAILLLFMGVDHPPTQADHLPLTPRRKLAGFATLGLLVAVFIPAPIQFVEERVPPGKRDASPPAQIEVLEPSASAICSTQNSVQPI